MSANKDHSEPQRMNLTRLPPEVLDRCTACLPGVSVGRLWLCGDRLLHRNMREGGVTALAFNFHDRKVSPPRLPSFCAFLPKLTSFSWFLSSSASASAVSIRIFDCLPKTLRSLRVNRRLDFAEPLIERKPFMAALSEMFPVLESIEATRLGEGSHSIVPASLTSITVTNPDRLHFPHTLTSLSVQDVGPVVFSSWIAFQNSSELPPAVLEFFGDTALCANLTTFSLQFSTGEVFEIPESWDLLPRSLTHLRLCANIQPTGEHFLHLPLGLRFFAYTIKQDTSSVCYDAKSIASLPRNLTHLELTEQHLVSQFSKIHPSTIVALPSTLQSLIVSFDTEEDTSELVEEAKERAIWENISFHPHLHTLHSMSSLRGATLPKSITDLFCHLNEADSGLSLVLPPNLVSLELQFRFIANLDLQPISNLHQLLILKVIGETQWNRGLQTPFWPKSLVQLEIKVPLNIDYVGPSVSDDNITSEWLESIPPSCHTLTWLHPNLCPIFKNFSIPHRESPSHLPSIPSSITKLGIIALSGQALVGLPRSICQLSFCSLEHFDPQYFKHLPSQLENAYIYGQCKELLPEHIGLLPPNLSKIRLMIKSIPDVVKATAMAADIQIHVARTWLRE